MIQRSTFINYLIISVGAFGVVLTLGYDFMRPGVPEFGRSQFMGFIASVMICLVGLRKLNTSKRSFWDLISLFIYLAGLLYLVLMPHGNALHGHRVFLGLSAPPKLDFILNVFGFTPLGYFFLSFYYEPNRRLSYRLLLGLALVLGLSLSLTIECVQYFIPGRSSSLFDVAANGFGTLVGMCFYFLDKLISERPPQTSKPD